ncbi:MAG: hypothetical protein HQ557_08880 [Bacteroidetes bacterium]|nr:hypothetical protein [Bacteroidota bacterium]
MKFNIRKISAIASSALMLGMTMGVAAAANYPQPFVVGGSANVAVVYGTGAGVSALDAIEAGNIQTNLQSFMGSGSGGTTVIGGDAWEVGTSSDFLEIGEPIKGIENYISESDLALLTDGTISNEKGESKYNQFLYFEDLASSSVTYSEDDDDNVGLFFKVNSAMVIARYVMDFTTNLQSDIETDNELSDIEDKEITLLGKTYTIVTANNGSSGVELTLMSGALGGTINNDEEITIDGYTVSVVVSSATAAQFTVNGETTDKMAKGDMEKLSDENYIAVTDITYEQYAGGIHAATFYIGADKIELKNGSSMTVNAETISDAKPLISATESGGDISISEISVNMTAEDDLFVPVDGKLSEATDLDEPQVLLTQNWDIEFKGLEARDTEEISLKVSESDKQYTLNFQDYDGNTVSLPLVYTNTTGVYGGDKPDHKLVFNTNLSVINSSMDKNDYFILNTANPESSTSNAKSFVVQYKGSDKVSDTTPQASFEILGSGDEKNVDISSTGTFTLKLGGGTFNFANATTAESDDFGIKLSGATDYSTAAGIANISVSQFIRTQYNTLIEITDTNMSDWNAISEDIDRIWSSPWTINVSVDDANRDDDNVTLSQQIFRVSIGNSSTDATTTWIGDSKWLTDNDNSDRTTYITTYGAEIVRTDPSESPAEIIVTIPKSIAKPLVYISSGDLEVSTSTGGAAQLGDIIVKDSEVSSVSSKNLIIVGGSCINSAAVTALGLSGSTCSAAFTEATGVGSGEFLIESVGDAFATGKIALVVAGYDAADTVNGAKYLRTQAPDTTAGKKYKGTSSIAAELVTTTTV